MDYGSCTREVRMYDDPVHVAHNEQGWILQGLAVFQELVIGHIQILVPALVLPAEEALLPNIRPSIPAAVL